ncbi:hypothetical protein LCGC14_2539920 [marine sediment metagenome]|uniref:ATP-grasp domain-containing protein n=1 Tax=marine sediment metagenome TaxID=412755 RepID=A0A0F9DJ28_9ZZZZ
MTDRISLDYWFPKLVGSGVNLPITEIIKTDADFWPWLDGEESPSANEFLNLLKSKGDEWGYPLFLRTGHTAAKHSWKDSCFVESEEKLGPCMFGLVETSAMALPGMPTDIWVIREFLDLDIRFHAFWGNMPIAVEWRFFIEPRRVICHHPYWPAEAFELIQHKPDDWSELLEEMNNDITEKEFMLLEHFCDLVLVKGKFDGRWSVDFARGKNKTWYVTDMAPMEVSYHWPGCENG